MDDLLQFGWRKFLGGTGFLAILVAVASLIILVGTAAYAHPLGLAVFAGGAVAGAASLYLYSRHAKSLRRLLQFLPHHA